MAFSTQAVQRMHRNAGMRRVYVRVPGSAVKRQFFIHHSGSRFAPTWMELEQSLSSTQRAALAKFVTAHPADPALGGHFVSLT